MAIYNGEPHSTIEVWQVETQLDDTHKEASQPDKEAIQPDKEAIQADKEAIQPEMRPLPYDETLPEIWDQNGFQKVTTAHTICKLRPRTLWFIIILAVLAIAAIVGGSTAATIRRSKRPEAIRPASPAGIAPANVSNASTPAHILSDTGLASVAWNDTNNITQHRLYYQDEDNMIKESSWNSSAKLWSVSNSAIGKAKNASPIAATVTGPPDFRLQINLYTINEGSHIREWVTLDGQNWNNGSLNSANILPSPSSNLAAIWHRKTDCTNCPNTVLVIYQDNSGKLQLGNGTLSGWQWSTLQANPVLGSGLTIHQSWQANNIPGLRLGYQIANGHLCTLDWNAWNTNVAGDLWQLREDNPLPIISTLAPLASFTWGTAHTNGLAIIINILSSSSHGVRSDWWTGVAGGSWPPPQSPAALSNVQNYTSLAANADAHIYALQDGGIREFQVGSDGTTYTLVGDVITS